MEKIKWDLVDREIFAQYRHANANEIADAYAEESFKDDPSDTVLATLWEMGQGRFSAHYNNREQRDRLFMLHANQAASAYRLESHLTEGQN